MNKEYTYIDGKVVVEDTDRLPFKVKNQKPNKELIEALKEENKILKELKTGKRWCEPFLGGINKKQFLQLKIKGEI